MYCTYLDTYIAFSVCQCKRIGVSTYLASVS